MRTKSIGLLLVIATLSASAGPSTPPTGSERSAGVETGRKGAVVTPWPSRLPCPRFKDISLWIPADAPRTLEWRVKSDAAPLLILEPGSPLSPQVPAEQLAALRELSSPDGRPANAMITAECPKTAEDISWNCQDGVCSVSAGYRAKRRGPPDSGFVGPRGWLCAGARKCARKERLLRLLASAPGEWATRDAELVLSVTSDLHAELRALLREVCQSAPCAAGLDKVGAQLPPFNKGWTITSVSASSVDLITGGAITGGRAILKSPASDASVELFCGRSSEGEPVCLLDGLGAPFASYRYIASASGPGASMQELELGSPTGALWHDGERIKLIRAALATRP